LKLLDECVFYYLPLGPFWKVARLRLTERLQKGEYMNINTQMRYGAYSVSEQPKLAKVTPVLKNL